MLLDRRLRLGLDVADRRPDLVVGIGSEVLHQEVEQAGLALEQSEQPHRLARRLRRRGVEEVLEFPRELRVAG